ncbi:DsrE family protein [Nitrospira moscoviensis]|uniref:DsrE family protein n=1 Tax=Nitrospira moscoviensis TaxID=42253 RepID=UPI001930F693|nr:DsrE family protein [Nitrospira moscoviensis]
MLKAVVSKKGAVHACGTCAEARGLQELKLVEGVEVGTVSGLAQSVVEADKVLTF